MSRCVGYITQASGKKDALPCLPATVIYGHAAARRLDVNRWSIGLDSACVSSLPSVLCRLGRAYPILQAKGKRLSALVLGDEGKLKSITQKLFDGLRDIPFGDEKRARVVSVKCR